LHVVGDLAKLMEGFHRAAPAESALIHRARKGIRNVLKRPNSYGRARPSIEAHYNLGNAFFEKWLDPEMMYTCAFFATESTSLADAQLGKMAHTARKLRLRPGQRVVDAGSGWGGLGIYLATNYGVSVDGYCLASDQVSFANARARAKGVADRARFHLADYREIKGSFDRFVSMGMLEHVGKRHHQELATVINRCLAPGGIGLLHSEGRMREGEINEWFERRIFPGAYIPSLAEMSSIVDSAGCTVFDVENLGPHYALTLKHWLANFNCVADQVQSEYGEDFVRLWRLYLTSGMAAFRAGSLHLFQIVFARNGERSLPLTREDLYLPASSMRTID
jgi:cyclopropane-fatty-acyl-phospholipid synthase